MSPKPPFTRTARSGWLGHGAIRLKSLAVVGAVTLGLAGTALVAALPVSADPAENFIAIGSDTTENVMDFFAVNVGGGILGSYDAAAPVSQSLGQIITPAVTGSGGNQLNCEYTRPNGSGQGLKTLIWADTNGTAGFPTGLSTGLNTNPGAGCVQLSRSSGGPGGTTVGGAGTAGSLDGTGNLVYIPFAIDAVTYATGPVTATPVTTQCVAATTGCTNVGTNGNPPGIGTISFTTTPTAISQTLNLSQAQLTQLYGQCTTPTGTTLNPVGASFAFTATSASPAVFTATGSAFAAGQLVTLGGTLPGGFSTGTSYFVVNPSGATFQLALTAGGTAINSTSTGTGTVDTPGNVDLYVPQPGSGTLSFWESKVGSTNVVQPCWHQTIVAGPAAGITVEEHDGSAIASDPNGIAPNSIAKWIGMNTGTVTPDVRHGSVLQSVTVGTAPNTTVVPPINGSGSMNISGCVSGGAVSACFPINREVYNVMDFYEVVSGSTPPAGTLNNTAFNSVLGGLFTGAGSGLCTSGFMISQLGFGPMPTTGSTFADQCGSTASTLRVQMNNTTAQG